MLTKNQIAADIEEQTGIKPGLVKSVLDALADCAAEEIFNGEDFTIPGIVRLRYNYRGAQRKGERYKKGDTVTGVGGVERVADADSPPRTERCTLKAYPTGEINKLKPGTKPEAQKAFFQTKAGKAVRARKK